jgi:hypothetical protein
MKHQGVPVSGWGPRHLPLDPAALGLSQVLRVGVAGVGDGPPDLPPRVPRIGQCRRAAAAAELPPLLRVGDVGGGRRSGAGPAQPQKVA